MKLLKKIKITSNGSFYFCYKLEADTNKQVFFQLIDDKNFSLNQKKALKKTSLKNFVGYKKKYLT